ncbi:hypothetical protein PR202_gb04390 [Eleusine coracana subsp. coracana]|uniref:trans-cinnamate 4-monooxygenase n=1 Tax=Eleusine coracana subsp. coracana TaxID=191504 RepID=A0AAV5E3Q0_ELECO|nr:hypothetical protein PR202_gb04390 [Eleusine coracana subsp. coracana]
MEGAGICRPGLAIFALHDRQRPPPPRALPCGGETGEDFAGLRVGRRCPLALRCGIGLQGPRLADYGRVVCYPGRFLGQSRSFSGPIALFESVDDPLFQRLKKLNGERSGLAQSFEYNYGDFSRRASRFPFHYCAHASESESRNQNKGGEAVEHQARGQRRSQVRAIDHILEAQRKGEINEDNLLYIVENINVAAIETTLWSIEWAIAELVNHPEIQQKLRHELDTVLGPGHQTTEPDTHRLPYLQALGGYDIPAETKVLVNAWHLANNPESWKRPEEFRPERFLDEEEKHVEPNGNDFRYLPFGVGRRSCPGIILALPILGITVGRLVHNFELLLPPPGQDKVDATEKGGQFSLHILNHSTIVCKPRAVV